MIDDRLRSVKSMGEGAFFAGAFRIAAGMGLW